MKSEAGLLLKRLEQREDTFEVGLTRNQKAALLLK
jgi:hypothetical protein